ncbi:MAG: hypothetical protein GY928_11455 [Colwellia sp.]|nr:hypothetical protein [Colwellia sp.]
MKILALILLIGCSAPRYKIHQGLRVKTFERCMELSKVHSSIKMDQIILACEEIATKFSRREMFVD